MNKILRVIGLVVCIGWSGLPVQASVATDARVDDGQTELPMGMIVLGGALLSIATVAAILASQRKRALVAARNQRVRLMKQQGEMKELLEELEQKNDELRRMHMELSHSNASLQGQVKERTRQLEAQTQLLIEQARNMAEANDLLNYQMHQLQELARLNSHDVRRPLARILGTMELMDLEGLQAAGTMKQYLKYIRQSALECDAAIELVQENISRFQEVEKPAHSDTEEYPGPGGEPNPGP